MNERLRSRRLTPGADVGTRQGTEEMAGNAVIAVGAFDHALELRGRMVDNRSDRQPVDIAIGDVREPERGQNNASRQRRGCDPGTQLPVEGMTSTHAC